MERESSNKDKPEKKKRKVITTEENHPMKLRGTAKAHTEKDNKKYPEVPVRTNFKSTY